MYIKRIVCMEYKPITKSAMECRVYNLIRLAREMV